MSVIIALWALHAAPAAVLSFPIVYFARKRVHWYMWEMLAFVFPFCVWSILVYLRVPTPFPKDLGNGLSEPIYFGLAIPVAVLIRAVFGQGRETDERVFASILLLALCVFAAIVYFVTPYIGGGSFG